MCVRARRQSDAPFCALEIPPRPWKLDIASISLLLPAFCLSAFLLLFSFYLNRDFCFSLRARLDLKL